MSRICKSIVPPPQSTCFAGVQGQFWYTDLTKSSFLTLKMAKKRECAIFLALNFFAFYKKIIFSPIWLVEQQRRPVWALSQDFVSLVSHSLLLLIFQFWVVSRPRRNIPFSSLCFKKAHRKLCNFDLS